MKNTRSDFESAVTAILPVDPYKKSRSRHQPKLGANVSSVGNSAGHSAPSDGVGTTGVAFKFHDGKAYQKLSAEQKKELHDWRVSPCGKKLSESERIKEEVFLHFSYCQHQSCHPFCRSECLSSGTKETEKG